ncbi:MAG TPA: hypothetical protein VED59_05980, partial [Acidimicrobiales bacterium]|nr:hypothetical protein [Acidimicrobiales bacterium]
MAGQLAIARPGDGRSLTDALRESLAKAVTGEPCAIVVAGGNEGQVPEQALVDLLCGPLGIGAVVPLLYDERGRVVEAGTYAEPDGTVAPYATGSRPGAAEHTFRRDVPGTASVVIGISAQVLAGFATDGREGEEDQATTVQRVLAHVRSRGQRIVYEPDWLVRAPASLTGNITPAASAGPRRWGERDRDTPTRLLVVTGTIPGTRVGAEALASLVETITRCPATRVTLACADGFGASRYAARYRQQGIEVVTGPRDWPRWCEDRRYHYSHVLVSDEGLTTALWSLARASQPQAMAVLYCERLPFRRNQGLGEASWHTEGLETVTATAQARLLGQLEGIEAAWCANPADASLLAGLMPAMRVASFWPALAAQSIHKGFADREGIALVATDGFDITADPERGALEALQQLVPGWRRRDAGLHVKIVSDWPTPGLAHLAKDVVGAEIVPSSGDLVRALSGVRAVIAPAATSGSAWITAALAAGTPWVANPGCVSGLDLGELGTLGTEGDLAALRHRAWSLLSDEATWETHAAAMATSLAALLGRRDAALHEALLQAGMDPPGSVLWPLPLDQAAPRPARPQVQVPLRPPQVADPPAIFVPDSLNEDERYALWHQRRGPNAEVVAAIGAE